MSLLDACVDARALTGGTGRGYAFLSKTYSLRSFFAYT